MKTPPRILPLLTLLLCTACSSLNTHKKTGSRTTAGPSPQQVQPAKPATPGSPADTPASVDPTPHVEPPSPVISDRIIVPSEVIAPVQAKGTSYGFNLFGFIPLKKTSQEIARASLYSAMGKHVSDTTIALEKTVFDRKETHFVLFSIPRVVLTAEVVRTIPARAASLDPGDIPGAPLRRGLPVFPKP